MLDIKRIREATDEVRERLAAKGAEELLDPVLDLDRERRRVQTEVDQWKNRRNVVSKEIGAKKKAGEDISSIQAEMRQLGDQISSADQSIRELEEKFQDLLLRLPNLPHTSTPNGKDAADNVVVRQHGEPRTFTFAPKPHWEVGQRLGYFDLERGAKISGAGFPLFTGVGARMQRALINFMLDVHTTRHGYREIAPPVLVNAASMTGTGQLPKMKDDMYYVGADELYLAPTAEVPVTNIYRDDIIPGPLPVYLTAYTPCFRREAGAAGRETRGLIRVHQFDKIELVKFVEPSTSYDELESLLKNAETILQELGLTYRVLQLCSGDLSLPRRNVTTSSCGRPATTAGWKFPRAATSRIFKPAAPISVTATPTAKPRMSTPSTAPGWHWPGWWSPSWKIISRKTARYLCRRLLFRIWVEWIV